MKCPYTFPHRSNKAMRAYLAEHESYVPANTWNGGFVLAWNVKIYRLDSSGKTAPADFPVNDWFDSQWYDYVQSNDYLFDDCCESAASYYTEKTWTNYPGIEQGEWDFGMSGRSGGYMVLTECPAWVPAPCAWRQFSMIWSDRAHYHDWLEQLDTATLRQFYRAIRVLDRDLSREAAEQEVAYHYSARRYDWEQELIAQEDCAVKRLEASRPDLYTA